MFNQKLTRSLLIVGALVLPGLSYADSFEDAVNEYLKGFKECTEANTLRSKDLAGAKKKFDTYLKTLDKAIAIDSAILNSTERDMDKNLRYCERVEIDIKRAEATPILEKGLGYCDTAKNALDSGDVAAAQSSLDEYKRYRDDAFIITETVMDVFAIASRVRACSRVEEKLAEASRKESAVAEAMSRAATDYQSFLKECNAAKSSITSPKFSLNDVDSINQQLTNALKYKKAARENGDALATMSAQPEREESIKLKQLVDSSTTCEGELTNLIRTATKNKQLIEKNIADGAAQLQKSLAACESAQKQSERISEEADLAKAEADYQNSANLKRKVTSDAKLIDAAQTYRSWKASQDFAQLMNTTEACQNKAAANIKSQKTTLTAKAQKAKDDAARQAKEDAARQAKAESERKKLADEQAKKEADAAAKEQARLKEEAAAKAKKAEAEKAAKAEAAAAADDDLGTLDDNEDGKAGKSWTDLVR